jgi:GR25 family glycosyltransferase involved in LPS biosynthesis
MRLAYRAMLSTRYLGPTPPCQAIGAAPHGQAIERIYVINLARHTERWDRMCGELSHLTDNSGRPISALATRFQAVDGRQLSESPSPAAVTPSYSLADQLFVEPHPVLDEHFDASSWDVEMTRQEVAIALSHIGVWEMVAASDCAYTLILEDDVYFRRSFCRDLDRAWSELVSERGARPAFDLLYVSYKEAKTGKRAVPVSESIFKPLSGLWQLSGYVLSRRGARELLDALPVRGPVDTWINRQFEAIDVFATRRPIVEQRSDCRSANLYSILPVLSQVGILTREKALLARFCPAPAPVFAFGEQGTGLTALGVALSMLGYRCCSDLTQLPKGESEALFENKPNRVFDAYINIGFFTTDDYIGLARMHSDAQFIICDNADRDALPEGHRRCELQALADELRRTRPVLILRADHADKWQALCSFLGCDYPIDQYPDCTDSGQRPLSQDGRGSARFAAKDLRRDPSPWIVAPKNWQGIALVQPTSDSRGELSEHGFAGLDNSHWMVREDTFPSNLALFTKNNVAMDADRIVRLTIRKEHTAVREFTSAALCSRQRYLYGRFMAEVRAASAPGLITGIFLHRNSPRQEIDIEIIGKDTRKMLVNVFYNPGVEGSRMEYGYRGAPTLIDLGFDASEDFHEYEIEWSEASIRWHVDGRLVYERANWDPTPIPHLPMQFNFNLWHSRSRELAGRLNPRNLPTFADLRALRVGHDRSTTKMVGLAARRNLRY